MNHSGRLLEQAIRYSLDAVGDVTPALLTRPTPCRDWNLDMLLRHAHESLTTIHDGILGGQIDLVPASPPPDPAVDPARAFRDRAGRYLAAQAFAGGGPRGVTVGDRPVPAAVVQCAGALEIAMHGWDIAQACARYRRIPDPLALGLLAVAPLLVPETGRHPLFHPPVRASTCADPTDRLVAFLGRRPITAAG